MHWGKKFILKAWPPLILLFATLAIDVLALFNIIPSSAELFEEFANIARSAGVVVIFVLTLVEHTVFLGVYFPAAVVILISMGNTHGSISAALSVFSAILAGQIGGYSLSYMIGRRMKDTEEQGAAIVTRLAIFMTFIHPHAGAISSFLIGTRNVGWRSFAMTLLLALGVWSTFWAIIAYFGMIAVVSEVGWDVVFYVYMAVWLIAVAWQVSTQKRLG